MWLYVCCGATPTGYPGGEAPPTSYGQGSQAGHGSQSQHGSHGGPGGGQEFEQGSSEHGGGAGGNGKQSLQEKLMGKVMNDPKLQAQAQKFLMQQGAKKFFGGGAPF